MTLSEALAASEEATGPVNDVIIIDAESRMIDLPLSESLFGVEGEKDVERKCFRCSKIVGDNIDLSTHQIYVHYATATTKTGGFDTNKMTGAYHCDDVEIDETGSYITFSWRLSDNALSQPGFVGFAVFAKYSDGEELKTKWKTQPAIGTVARTVPDGEVIVEKYPDVINQIFTKLAEMEKGNVLDEAVAAAVADYMAANPVEGTADAVKYTAQTLTEEHQTQARANIGAASSVEVSRLSKEIADYLIKEIPNYWVSELETKANEIQIAMEEAGCNKSAFLWYTDAHWDAGNSKMSPRLLKYLYYHTSMNKVNFGGDIIGDPSVLTHETAKHLYSTWRKYLKGLPNHHSVLGNHDNFYDSNLTYAYLIAPEESGDMVIGGEFYYYIDNPCERTRYLYLDSGTYKLSDNETEFIIESLKSTPNGWHIVVISHIWFQYTSASEPSVGNMNTYMQKALNLFDSYNARQSGIVTMESDSKDYDFTDCGGKVEFCIGGHIHIDLDLTSNGGIPVIITASDVNQERSSNESEDCGTTGTITESAIYGFVADYVKNKVTVIGVGRGGSRIIDLSDSASGDDTVEVTNYADPTSPDWLTGYRLSTSSTSSTGNTSDIVTNYVPCEYGEIVTIEGLDVRSYSGGNARYHMCDDDKAQVIADSGYVNDLVNKGFASVDGNVITIQAGYIGATGSYTADSTLQRFCGKLMDGYTANDVVITVTKPNS